MKYALSHEGRATLDSLLTRPILYAFDFDGTLAPISADRASVALPPSVRQGLLSLNRRVPCAVISGRALPDLLPRLGGAVTHVLGNHGLESASTPPTVLARAEGVCREWEETLRGEYAPQLSAHGVDIEPKRYSLTLHYRHASRPAEAHACLTTVLNGLTPPPRLTWGHLCLNALPPDNAGKGAAAAALVRRLGLAGLFYIGDDGADEDVFGLPDALAMSVRVGTGSATQAHFYLTGQEEVGGLIQYLVDASEAAGPIRRRAAPGLR